MPTIKQRNLFRKMLITKMNEYRKIENKVLFHSISK